MITKLVGLVKGLRDAHQQRKQAPSPAAPTRISPPIPSPIEAEQLQVAELAAAATVQPIPQNTDLEDRWLEALAIITTAEPVSQDSVEVSYAPQDNPELSYRTQDTPTTIDRATEVQAALDEAAAGGLETYAALIKFVELKTGKGCSRRAVAAWKKTRQGPAIAA